MPNNPFFKIDYSQQKNKQEQWIKNREHRGNIYKSFGEYINFLEKLLFEEKDEHEKFLIEKRIKKLKKEQEKYYDPCILAMPIDRNKFDEEKEIEESKSLIKRMFKKKI